MSNWSWCKLCKKKWCDILWFFFIWCVIHPLKLSLKYALKYIFVKTNIATKITPAFSQNYHRGANNWTTWCIRSHWDNVVNAILWTSEKIQKRFFIFVFILISWTFKNTSLAIQEEGINSAKVAYKTVQISIFWKKNIKDHLHIVLLLSGIQRSNQNELYKFTGVTLYSVETEMQSSY